MQIPVMKGIQVNTIDCPKTPVPIDELRKMPTLEQSVKEVAEKKKYEEEWEKKNGKITYSVAEDV